MVRLDAAFPPRMLMKEWDSTHEGGKAGQSPVLSWAGKWKNPMVSPAKMMLSPLLGKKGTEVAPDRVL